MYELLNNATKLSDIFIYSNNITYGWLGVSIVLMSFVIPFIALKNYETSRAFAFASIFACIMSMFLIVLGMISNYVFGITIIMAALSVVYLFKT